MFRPSSGKHSLRAGIERRVFLLGGAASLTAGLVASRSRPLSASVASQEGALRVAFLTDPHVSPSPEAEAGFARALETAQTHSPALMILGGDAIMDALATPLPDVERQWSTFHRLLRDHCSVPLMPCIGNHDVFGWSTPERHPSGKEMARDQMGLKESYYAFDQGAWRFIVLDSTHWDPQRTSGYVAMLDEAQMDWLGHELAATSKWVCIVSHIPIFAPCVFFDGPNERSGDWLVPGEWMHLDARRLKSTFADFPKVKACLSGHIHLVDQVEYLGVSYFCNGAVCGDYWRGDFQEFAPAYALFDFFPDGSVRRTMIDGFR